MIIVMKEHATEKQTERVVRAVLKWGLDVHRSTGAHRAVLGIVGDLANVPQGALEKIPGVARVVYISTTPEEAARARRRMKAPKDSPTIAIVGLGQMGGSLAMALRETWPNARVVGLVRKKRGRKIPKGVVHDLTSDPREALSRADVVVFATPVATILQQLHAWAKFAKPGSVWTDLGSTKAEICRAAAKHLPKQATFIGGHPMAGSAGSGIAHARADLYENETWALTPPRGTRLPKEAGVLKKIVIAVGARLVVMDAASHDRVVAATSHLPQLVSSALAAGIVPILAGTRAEHVLRGPAFRDMTRLALSPYEPMWRDIFTTNRGNVEKAMKEFERTFRRLRGLDKARLARIFEEGRRLREKF